MILNVFQAAKNVATLGYGFRAAIWVQGCAIGCPGCCSPETWAEGIGQRVTIQALIQWIARGDTEPDGLTISGGEATAQADAVSALVAAFRARWPNGDVLLFTGLRFEVAKRRHPALVAMCDMICAGPYVRGLPSLPLRGSNNQTLHALTPLARARYRDVDDWPIASQTAFHAGRVVTVGIPDSAALARASSKIAEIVA